MGWEQRSFKPCKTMRCWFFVSFLDWVSKAKPSVVSLPNARQDSLILSLDPPIGKISLAVTVNDYQFKPVLCVPPGGKMLVTQCFPVDAGQWTIVWRCAIKAGRSIESINMIVPTSIFRQWMDSIHRYLVDRLCESGLIIY